jgi:hypothetical protein
MARSGTFQSYYILDRWFVDEPGRSPNSALIEDLPPLPTALGLSRNWTLGNRLLGDNLTSNLSSDHPTVPRFPPWSVGHRALYKAMTPAEIMHAIKKTMAR